MLIGFKRLPDFGMTGQREEAQGEFGPDRGQRDRRAERASDRTALAAERTYSLDQDRAVAPVAPRDRRLPRSI
jgi:hypothetical protein